MSSGQDACGEKPIGYRAPGFTLTRDCCWALEILLEEGFRFDSSIYPGKHPNGGMVFSLPSEPFWLASGSAAIQELPITTFGRWPFAWPILGGGFFRVTPDWLIALACSKSDYLMAYFHPRDFFLPEVDGISSSIAPRLRDRMGIKSSKTKLEHVLKITPFIGAETALATIDWPKAPRIDPFIQPHAQGLGS